MHVTPELALQQSLVVVHRSPFVEQPELVDWQEPAPALAPASAPASLEPASFGTPAAQYPPQQSVPVAHILLSSCRTYCNKNNRIYD